MALSETNSERFAGAARFDESQPRRGIDRLYLRSATGKRDGYDLKSGRKIARLHQNYTRAKEYMLAQRRKSLTFMVPRGGIEPPTP